MNSVPVDEGDFVVYKGMTYLVTHPCHDPNENGDLMLDLEDPCFNYNCAESSAVRHASTKEIKAFKDKKVESALRNNTYDLETLSEMVRTMRKDK